MMASKCIYEEDNFKQRLCDGMCSGKYCNGHFSCNRIGICTLSVPCGQTMILNEDNLIPQVLCNGALEYECEDQINWPGICDPKYLKGAVQFSSTVLKDCTALVNQGRYNRDNMECTCTACQDCGLLQCGKQRLYCNCSVVTFPFEITSIVNNRSEQTTSGYKESITTRTTQTSPKPAISRTESKTSTTNSKTSASKSASTTIPQVTASSLNPITFAGAKTEGFAVTDATIATAGGKDNFLPEMIGGVLGGVLFLILIIVMTVYYKRLKKGIDRSFCRQTYRAEYQNSHNNLPRDNVSMATSGNCDDFRYPGFENTNQSKFGLPRANNENNSDYCTLNTRDNDNVYDALGKTNSLVQIPSKHDAADTDDADTYICMTANHVTYQDYEIPK